jgi:hypothetical protein
VYVGRLRADVERVDLVGDRAPFGVDLLDVVGELLLELEQVVRDAGGLGLGGAPALRGAGAAAERARDRAGAAAAVK